MEEQDNMEEPLKSSLSIKILSDKTRQLLSDMLNPVKLIHTSEGFPRYWKGLAELCGIQPYLISSIESNNSDQTNEVLKHWNREEGKINLLISYLEILDRFDIIDEIEPLIADDIKYHLEHPNDVKKQEVINNVGRNVLTIDDVDNLDKNEPLIKYDAFVLYADEDIDFATVVIETMEKQYNLKFCVKDRDLVGGIFEHNAIIKLISERCEKLIVILSPRFFKSAMNNFFLNFTQAISLEERKIIPCLYENCEMPAEVRCYFMLDYTKPKVWNLWDKLYHSIKAQKESNRIPLQMNARETTNTTDMSHCVKFNSLVDLTNPEKHQIADANMNASTSVNSLGTKFNEPEMKIKQKTSWFREFLKKCKKNYDKCSQHIETNGDVDSKRDKSGFWNRHRKKKEEIAT